MSTRVLIRELAASQRFAGVLCIQNCQLGQSKNGSAFIKCILSDRSAQMHGRMWNASQELFSTLPTDGFVKVDGYTQPYQGQLQFIIEQIMGVKPSGMDLEELLPRTKFDIDKMFAELKNILAAIQNPGVKALVNAFLDDEELMTLFRRAPAAMSLHHAYIGGLLEHTLNLLRVARVTLPLYPELSSDIVFAGLFLHDIGKCAELSWNTGFSYTDEGQLVGHIARGMLWLQRKADDARAMGAPISEPVLRVLHHILLSHHGKPEFGALKIPATPEAIFVSQLDNLDAKMQMAIAAARSDDGKADGLGGNFTDKIWALETKIYKPDPTTVEE